MDSVASSQSEAESDKYILSELMSIRKTSHLAIPSRAIDSGPLCSQPSPPALFAQERPVRTRSRFVVVSSRLADHLRRLVSFVYRYCILDLLSTQNYDNHLSSASYNNLIIAHCCVQACGGERVFTFRAGGQTGERRVSPQQSRLSFNNMSMHSMQK